MGNEQQAGAAGKFRTTVALPGRVSDDRVIFHQSLGALLELTGGELPAAPPGATPADQYQWEDAARRAAVASLPEAGPWPRELFGALIAAVVHDPDPSSNRWLIERAMAATGRRALQETLIGLLVSGTDAEKAGAARAWYWTLVPVRYVNWEERILTEESRKEYDAVADFRLRWQEAALREFVANDDLDVRRCVLPLLTLNPADNPQELRDLVAAAVSIARAHPDEYIRRRVEDQV